MSPYDTTSTCDAGWAGYERPAANAADPIFPQWQPQAAAGVKQTTKSNHESHRCTGAFVQDGEHPYVFTSLSSSPHNYYPARNGLAQQNLTGQLAVGHEGLHGGRTRAAARAGSWTGRCGRSATASRSTRCALWGWNDGIIVQGIES